MTWKHLRGARVKATCKCGGTDMVVGVPFIFTSNVAVACADGGAVNGVTNEAMTADTDYYEYEILVPGSVWRVDKATGDTLKRGEKVAMATATTVDDGTTADPAIGMVVDQDKASADATVDIMILGEASAID